MEIIRSDRWLSELQGMDYLDYNFKHPMSPPCHYSFDELNFQDFRCTSYSMGEHENFSPQTIPNDIPVEKSTSPTELERPAKQLKTNNYNSCSSQTGNCSKANLYSSPQIISFENSGSSPANTQKLQGLDWAVNPKIEEGYEGIENYPALTSKGLIEDQFGSIYCGVGNKKAGTPSRSPLLAKEHVIAERKRREKLSERFIALSAVVPGLKKLDKASVLGETIKYLKHLQDRIKSLEKQASKKTVESVVVVKRSHVYIDNDTSSTDDNSGGCFDQLPLPLIEAKVSDKDILIRIHCETQKDCLLKIFGEIEQFHLNVIHSSVMPFGSSTLDVTIVAQMEVDHCMAIKDLVRNLRQALL